MVWKLSKQRTMHQLLQIFNLLIFAHEIWQNWCGWKAKNLKKKAHENATPLRPLLGLVFACIMNRNEYSVIGKNVIIFMAFINIWSTVDWMREGCRQIGKPKFDLRQALDRLLRLHAPQTPVVRILRFGDFSKVSCEGAKLLRTIAQKHTGRERLEN